MWWCLRFRSPPLRPGHQPDAAAGATAGRPCPADRPSASPNRNRGVRLGREGEAPAEPHLPDSVHLGSGSAGASPSQLIRTPRFRLDGPPSRGIARALHPHPRVSLLPPVALVDTADECAFLDRDYQSGNLQRDRDTPLESDCRKSHRKRYNPLTLPGKPAETCITLGISLFVFGISCLLS